MILEECWRSDVQLQEIPIYQTSGLAQRALGVYQTYVEMMNDNIKAAFQIQEKVSCLCPDLLGIADSLMLLLMLLLAYPTYTREPMTTCQLPLIATLVSVCMAPWWYILVSAEICLMAANAVWTHL